MKKLFKVFILLLVLCITASQINASEIHDEITAGNIEKVKELIEKDPSVIHELNEDDKATPLHIAIECFYLEGMDEVVELLISKGADVNAVNNNGDTPLIVSVDGGHTDIVELLISKGADLNTEDSYGNTPIIIATWHGYKDIVELLKASGAEPPDKNDLLKICEGNLKNIAIALEMYGTDNYGAYPPSLEKLTDPSYPYMKALPVCPACDKPYIYKNLSTEEYYDYELKCGGENAHKDTGKVDDGNYPVYTPGEGLIN